MFHKLSKSLWFVALTFPEGIFMSIFAVGRKGTLYLLLSSKTNVNKGVRKICILNFSFTTIQLWQVSFVTIYLICYIIGWVLQNLLPSVFLFSFQSDSVEMSITVFILFVRLLGCISNSKNVPRITLVKGIMRLVTLGVCLDSLPWTLI